MARRVFLHVGLPKSGTTYLQAVLGRNKSVLAQRGLLYPGERWNHQVDAVRDLRRMAVPAAQRPSVEGAWPRLVEEISAWPDDALVSMEWLGSAAPAHVHRLSRDLADAEVHVVFTVRDLARTVPAAWQEFTQNRWSWAWPDFVEQVTAPDAAASPAGRAFWSQQDIERLLARWAPVATPERTHVVTVPHRSADPDELWRRMAQAVGLSEHTVDTDGLRGNASLGLESAELMRRINAQLAEREVSLSEYNQYFKHGLAKRVLATRRSGESAIVLPEALHGWAQERAERQIAAIEEAGVQVVGDLEDLRPTPLDSGSSSPPTAPKEARAEAVLESAVDALVAVILREREGGRSPSHGVPGVPAPGRRVREAYLDEVEWILSVLRDECGVLAHLGPRTMRRVLCGNQPATTDRDVDLGYVSAFDNPADVMVESLRIERTLRSRGLEVDRNSGGHIGIKVSPTRTRRSIDVVASYVSGGRLHPIAGPGVGADQHDVLPLRTVDVEGRAMPVPANAEKLLVSDDAPSRLQRRRVRGWFGGMRETRDHWAAFYAANASSVPTEPSGFARWVAERESPGRLVDLGCGTGRDTRYFAERGFEVVGVDAVTRYARPAMDDIGRENRPRLFRVNLDSLQETLVTGARLAHERGPRTVYARFLWHALSEGGRENAWRLVAMALAAGGRGYLEFRTPEDAGPPKHFGRHYRRYLAPGLVVSEAERHGVRVVEWDTGRGWSRLGDEDPHLCRMILERKH